VNQNFDYLPLMPGRFQIKSCFRWWRTNWKTWVSSVCLRPKC